MIYRHSKNLLFAILTYLQIVGTGTVFAQVNPTTNIIAVDVSTMPENGSFNYDSTFAIGEELGMTQTGLYFNWTTLETAPLQYDFTLLQIANIYYPVNGIAIDLTITPIHTNVLEMPADLVPLPLDHPSVIARFNAMLDSIHHNLTQLQLSSLVIGSEMDVYLGTDTVKWQQFTNFFIAVSAHAKMVWPTVPVACEATFAGLTAGTSSVYMQQINQVSDYIGVSYYAIDGNFQAKPFSALQNDFNLITSAYPVKPICFYQYGFPSSAACGSNLLLQEQFIYQTFNLWDTYASQIKMIDFTWMHDLDTAAVNYFLNYYGVNDPGFAGFLGSIGLREWNGNGSDKPALAALRCEAKVRGFNQLPLLCTSSIAELSVSDHSIALHPVPCTNNLNVTILPAFLKGRLEILDASGHQVYTLGEIKNEKFIIDTSNLTAGNYLIKISHQNQTIGKSFIRL